MAALFHALFQMTEVQLGVSPGIPHQIEPIPPFHSVIPLTAKDRFTALQSREIDLLSRNTTWTSSRDSQLGFNFAGVIYYDAQGFMVRKAAKVSSALELSNTTVCTQSGTTTQLNLADYFRSNNMKYEAVVFNTADEVIKAITMNSNPPPTHSRNTINRFTENPIGFDGGYLI